MGNAASMPELLSRWDTVDGLRIHALERTDLAPPGRTPIVLAHGAAVSSRHMERAAQALAASFPVYVPDYPGHGRSQNPPHVLDAAGLADFLAAWCRTAGLDRVHLLGNSFGCQVIAELAARRSELVERVVLQGPTVDAHAHGVRQVGRWFVNSKREGMTQPNETFGQWARAGPRVFVQTLLAMDRHRIEQALPRVRVPALVVRGSRDAIVPQHWAEEVTELLPDGRLTVIPGETHTIVLSAPEKLAAVVEPFLDTG
jgi:2-hydroxy-6-oxonona-2,4-dienedioate hydrolase